MTDDAPDDAPAADPTTEAPAAPAPEPEVDPYDAEEVRRGRVELLAAVLLGLAGALTAFAAYKAALTDGDALQGYTQSSKATSDANAFYDDYSQTYYSDQSLFLDYSLRLGDDPDGAAEIRDGYFSDDLEAATVVWEELSEDERPTTPLELDEYELQSYADYEEYTAEADQQFADGAKADDAGDKFELAGVYLSVSLFLAGVAALFRRHPVRYFALGMSVLSMFPGVLAMLDGQSSL